MGWWCLQPAESWPSEVFLMSAVRQSFKALIFPLHSCSCSNNKQLPAGYSRSPGRFPTNQASNTSCSVRATPSQPDVFQTVCFKNLQYICTKSEETAQADTGYWNTTLHVRPGCPAQYQKDLKCSSVNHASLTSHTSLSCCSQCSRYLPLTHTTSHCQPTPLHSLPACVLPADLAKKTDCYFRVNDMLRA